MIGCSYFGVRIRRHAARDLEDLAARGYTGVLHTFSENDLAYYRDTMREIVDASHAVGLAVQASPWGVGRTFGGEAESRFVTMHPEACQVLDDGRRVAAGCLNNRVYRDYVRAWADWALEAGVDYVFWDEPHWIVPAHVGVDDESRWACVCDACAERFGGPVPREQTPEVLAFREASLVDFLRELVAYVAERGGRNTICLLPLTEGSHGISNWDAVASLPGVSILATDPYWKNFGEEAGPFVGRFTRLLRETAERHGVGAQLWLPSFGLTGDDVPELEAAIAAAREEGVEDLWTWGYEACGHMTALATEDAPLVWEAVTAALTGGRARATEHASRRFAELDLLPTREQVRVLNAEDRTVANAVAQAGDALADAIDAIVERMRGGGRLVYVGAGTSGALAALDAAECGPTFGSRPGEVLALVAEETAGEDDGAAGAEAIRLSDIEKGDAVVAVSASGSTPYALAALESAREAGALTVAVACVRGSKLGSVAGHEIVVETGPEAIAGSTRLKAGTAQKLVLNTISTVTMVRLGRTFGGLMVGVAPENDKLRARARRNLALASGASDEQIEAALTAAAGDARVALVSLLAGIDPDAARERLADAGGSVRAALGVGA
jgi:N-acetylmuramic acid 6-phosphate etherase